MTAVHLHLMLNHVPVIGTAFTLVLLILALMKKSQELIKVSLLFFVGLAILSTPPYLAGESAAEQIKGIQGVSEVMIERHDQAAAIAFTGIFVIGIASLVLLIRYRKARPVPTSLALGVAILALIVFGLMAWTANLGGQIRHTEIRRGPPEPVTFK